MIQTLKSPWLFLIKKDSTVLETCTMMNINSSCSLALRKKRNWPETQSLMQPKDGLMAWYLTSSTAQLALLIDKRLEVVWTNSINTFKAVSMSGILKYLNYHLIKMFYIWGPVFFVEHIYHCFLFGFTERKHGLIGTMLKSRLIQMAVGQMWVWQEENKTWTCNLMDAYLAGITSSNK